MPGYAKEGANGLKNPPSDGRLQTMIPVYVINLERSVERRAWMERELARAGVKAEFVKAVDARRFGPRCSAAINARHSATYRLSQMEAALILSHRKVWRRIIASDARHAVVLEDDVHLGTGFSSLLDADLEQAAFDIIKLETSSQIVRLGRRIEGWIGDRELRRLRSTHWGTAAYLIRRAAIPFLLSQDAVFSVPIDHALFDDRSTTMQSLDVLQLVKAIAIQDQFMNKNNPSGYNNIGNTPEIESILDRGVLIKSRSLRARLHRKIRKFRDIAPGMTSKRTHVDFE